MRRIVLVHGAWHGPWCWSPVLARLDEGGVPAVAVELGLADLHDDAAIVTKAIEEGDGPVVLVGHSYGGAVITEAGAHPSVEHLVYLCAFAPDAFETVTGLALDHDGPHGDLVGAVVRHDDGTFTLDPALAPDALYGDCEEGDVSLALGLLRPQGATTFSQSPDDVAWRRRPATYIVCGADRGVPASLQREMAERIPDVTIVEWPESSHSPFFSRPAELAELLAGLAYDEAP